MFNINYCKMLSFPRIHLLNVLLNMGVNEGFVF